MEGNFKMLAKTLFGFEDLLARELRELGAGDIEIGTRSVGFSGDTGFMYKANLCCRTAIKILKPLRSFVVKDENALYAAVKSIDWSQYMRVNDTFAINATISGEQFTHSLFVAQKAKDAVVDQFREATGDRPDVDLKFPDLSIDIHIRHNRCTISLDSSGVSLHQRGYRLSTNIAPINEVLAAGCLMLAGWKGYSDFLDPMCGSGTMLIEAAMIACNIPPNLNRKQFGFENWHDWDPDLFDVIEAAALKKIREFHFTIQGYDLDPSVIDKAKENIKNAELSEFISIKQADFFKTEKERERHLHMVFNPPYGERIPVEMEAFYKNIGDTLKQNYKDTEAWFITSNLESLKHVGLRTSRKIKLYNGSLESRLVKYDIYAGSKKAKYQNND
ncbi:MULTISPECIES: THUMP domain-containing class I SAM-dependent RNA methyltransferase [Leeuwenhoekiella]|jgi:putative N6-adenine-specific DNA methylase|uniref:Putative N6-adenine-specific DNA methylase n=1 Tax=Leeuwenhoekiella blandensis (strain CECT 7118 / CCUG 51940 / KCTC 22103 / MED217) TaxID=398720 RepID=A3XN27_LEEBM|nr:MULTISPECIES: THUMP domain-containing protein [Leeuwenhoekiella]EAQ49049.1 putative N6-adenine-specific DNA methylase [Leeuwenhoekiella blandensis MED217]MAO45508.1 RNA methyltransferase [Leeuwenhoekiella sp.]HBT09820.1 RNA methyltransferase [Leeuwenhoekiella sp.]HCW65487.1 RNA methyltransferase [Leeuwenhoekiella sp.]|tara:strand:+ start:1877 stop:3040 length:1164 start_codon:yes stop_codon:yes gene_type:complete